MVLKRIGVLSCGKILAITYALIGLLIGLLFAGIGMLAGAAGMASGGDEAGAAMFFRDFAAAIG